MATKQKVREGGRGREGRRCETDGSIHKKAEKQRRGFRVRVRVRVMLGFRVRV
jgi:hypothetical protein